MINNDNKSELSSPEETRAEFNPGQSAIKLGIDSESFRELMSTSTFM